MSQRFLYLICSAVAGFFGWLIAIILSIFIILVWLFVSLVYSVFETCFVTNDTEYTNSSLNDCMRQLCFQYAFQEEIISVKISTSTLPVTVHCVKKCATETCRQTVIFVHGTASCSATFFDVMKKCPDYVTCIAIDLPKFGISDDLSINGVSNSEICLAFAEIIAAAITSLHAHDVVLVGHSLGGMICVTVAHKHPSLVRKLILLDPAGLLPTLGVYGYYWAVFFKLGIPSSIAKYRIFQVLLSPVATLFFDHSVTSKFWRKFISCKHATGHEILQRFITLRPFHAFWNTPVIARLLDISCPVFLCYGSDDTIIPSHMGSFFQELTGGVIQTHVITGAFHSPWSSLEVFMEYFVRILDCTVGRSSNKFDMRLVNATLASLMDSHWKNSYHLLCLTQLSIKSTYQEFKNIQVHQLNSAQTS